MATGELSAAEESFLAGTAKGGKSAADVRFCRSHPTELAQRRGCLRCQQEQQRAAIRAAGAAEDVSAVAVLARAARAFSAALSRAGADCREVEKTQLLLKIAIL